MASAGRGDGRDKVIERAQALAQRGAIGRAIATLEEFLASQPDDDRILLRLADLRRRVSDDAGAVEAFSKAAAVYAGRGFASKAAASLQQALAIAPDDVALLERLADAKAQLSLPREAIQYLDRIAEVATAAGDRPRVLALRRRSHQILPGDAGAAIRLADALVEAGAREEAVSVLQAALAPVEGGAHAEVWFLLQERLTDLLPADLARARELGRALLARGAPKKALLRLKPCLAADPGDVEALTLLAQCFAALGETDRVVACWREIAKAHQRAGRPVEAQGAWVHVRELSPADPEAAAVLAPPLPPRKPTATLAEDLAEADFFVAQGLADEGRAILVRLRGLYPEEPGIPERLEALDVETIPLAELLPHDEDDLASPAEDSTTDILERARAASGSRAADGASHRDLAETFLEMDRFDEALSELAMAIAADPSSEGACLALVGRCHLARGAPEEAIESYRLALDSEGLPAEATADVLCELGHSLELVGRRDEALRCFQQAKQLEPALLDGEEGLLDLVAGQA